MELAYSIGLGYPLISCSSAEPISVSPNNTNLVKSLTDTVHFTLPKFNVVDPDKLASIEVWAICYEMNVLAFLVNGKYYETK